tara:strand:+ start:859 stop:2637 length:1779 start_codon:yes stop_codon:yes gene_type:complete
MDNLHLIQLGQYERPTISEERNKDWVSIGDNNDYYQSLIDAYMDSTTNNAVINGVVNQIYGKGLDATDSAEKPDQYAQMKSLVKPHDLRNVCQDLKLLGEAAFQITYNGSKISAITHFPRETLRAEKMNEKGEVKNYFYSADWTKVNKNTKLKKFPVFGSGGQNEIYIVKRYVTGFYYYSPADYNTAYATLENEIACYLINDTQNGFSGTKVVNFNNGVPDREKQLAIKNDVMSKLTGSYGEKVIIAFNNNAESKTTVEDIPLNDAPAHYSYLSEECSKKIMLTHRVTSPLLLGLSSANGFSSNADEIENASRLFNNVVIQPYQNLLVDCLDTILAVNDISLNLYFKTIEPLEFMDLENVEGEEAIEEQTGIKEEDTTELEIMASKSVSDKDSDKLLKEALESLKGVKMDSEEFEIVDIRDLDDENDSVEDWAKSMIQLSDIVDSKEDGFSTLDKSLYKVRYKYAKGSSKGGESREFCKEMMSRTSSGIVYRLEDIDKASRDMNFSAAKLPMHNNKKYDLFKFKGGVYCRHKWQQILYKIKKGKEVGSDDLDDYKRTKSIPKSYEPKPRGRKQAVKAPVNMPNNGHHPNYKK